MICILPSVKQHKEQTGYAAILLHMHNSVKNYEQFPFSFMFFTVPDVSENYAVTKRVALFC